MSKLRLENLCVRIGTHNTLNKCCLTLDQGQLIALTGANGAGKTTLARTIAGSPDCIVESGQIYHRNLDITSLAPHERTRRGIFVSWQQPPQIAGIPLSRLLYESYRAVHGIQTPAGALHKHQHVCAQQLEIDQQLLGQAVNTCSGGQCKLSELLQLLVLEPQTIVLDEIDSGLDNQRLNSVIRTLLNYRQTHPVACFLVISHQPEFLAALSPNIWLKLEHGAAVPKTL